MLKSLSIKNYALISELDIDFQPGFSIVTGETGAGKSILLGALSLLIGQRADTSVLLDKTHKCTVEGIFDIRNYNLKEFFKDYDIDYEDNTIIRREINAAGKSRAFINDTPVNLQQLKELGINLVDIHSQHENIKLNLPSYQLDVIDAFAGSKEILLEYLGVYYEYKSLVNEFEGLKEENEKSRSDLDYYQFQFDQLENAKLQTDEQKELEEEQEILSNAEEIKAHLSVIENLLAGEDQSVVQFLKECVAKISKIKEVFHKSEDIALRLDSSYIELKDIAAEVELLNESVQYDPERLQFVNDRLNLIYTLQQKHNVNTITELIEYKQELQKKLDDIINFDSTIEKLEKKIEERKTLLERLANQLSDERQSVISQVEDAIIELLLQLGIPNARFKVRKEKLEDFSTKGLDKITFLFSANKQSPLEEINKVASGGELSRLMLSIKSIISESIALPTIIFDEIDSGVAGEVADKVGVIMKCMSTNLQVINITHSPQIASRGDYHYLVFKEDVANKTITKIKHLNNEERIIEIAKMLSGEELTEAAVSNAKELLNN